MPAYDPKTALVVVDVQNDFADPSGALYVRGGETVVPLIDQEIERAAPEGALVVYTQDWHPPSTPHFAKDGGIWPVHCVGDTWGAAFHPDLVVTGPVVRKGSEGGDGYSAFTVRDPESGQTSPTSAEELLRERGVERVAICGLATDYCVVESVIDARMLGFTVEVLGSAISAVDLEPGDGERAITRMRDAGAEIV
jgi:nicotinamidase/pyrazinamidase